MRSGAGFRCASRRGSAISSLQAGRPIKPRLLLVVDQDRRCRMGVALADMRGAGWLNGYLLVRWELAHVVSFCAAKLAALFQSYFLDNRRSPVRRGADKPVGGFLASRLDIDLNSERFAACAGLRSACDNDQSRHSREVASRFRRYKAFGSSPHRQRRNQSKDSRAIKPERISWRIHWRSPMPSR